MSMLVGVSPQFFHYLSPLAKAGFVEPVDAGNRSSCHSAYRLTRKGREFVKWH